MTVPLSVLDLAPVVSGGDARDALRRTLDLAQHAERFGYHRYWVAEHHLTPGVASSQPALLLGQLATVTERIRLGSGAVLAGLQTPLAIVEQFGMLDALYPGRFDLGLGRWAQRPGAAFTTVTGESPGEPHEVDGLLIPRHVPFTVPPQRLELLRRLLKQPGANADDLGTMLDDIDTLLTGPYADAHGNEARVIPGEGADLQVWVLGSSGGESAQVAGERGLPFTANYHAFPAKVLEAATAYRAAFRPSKTLAEPWLMVSADVVVAEDDATAQRLAAPYGVWVRSIRAGGGAIAYPSPEEALAHPWTDADRELVADRVDTQFVGTPAAVAERLATLRRVTGADELLVTTITHDHADRVRSFRLLAEHWAG
ncbi:LLM class flavin-dependent oxidoreductase [Actinoplanes sp. NPDC049118]|uniref:LLM class flavin-dependent oxidoreductase n=1 Tax=Actinoplanes sp. NPDC049118 TaxID=3155769 RepID=UPI00340C4196